jgi:hypothetical protein
MSFLKWSIPLLICLVVIHVYVPEPLFLAIYYTTADIAGMAMELFVKFLHISVVVHCPFSINLTLLVYENYKWYCI